MSIDSTILSDEPESFRLGFVCPKCSSSFFRTISFGEDMVRQCKGHYTGDFFYEDYSGCDYTWLDKYDNAHGLSNYSKPQEPLP